MSVAVLIAVVGPHEAALVRGLEGAAGVAVVRRCADVAELVAAAGAGQGEAALVSADLRRLDRGALGRLAVAGVAVVGVTASAGTPEEAEQSRRLGALGVRGRVAADAGGAEVAAAVLGAVEELAASLPVPPGFATADPAAALARRPAVAAGADGDRPAEQRGRDLEGDGAGPARGRVVAVWGAAGAPGRTTVATTLATELATAGRRTLLADADTWSASVAQVLGLLDESAGIAAACRAAGAGTLTAERLLRLAPEALPGLAVLTGLPRAARWPEVSGSALEAVWEVARGAAPWTVVDCAAPLEQDEELSFDTAAPRRNAATLTTLAAADTVLVVGSADPVGLQRLVRCLQDLAEAVPAARPTVVVTRVRASAVGPGPQQRVVDALARFAGVRDPVLVPDDREACDEALLRGRTLTESAPSSPARQALRALAGQLVAEQEPPGREQTGRRAAAASRALAPATAGGSRRGDPASLRRGRWARMHPRA